MTRKISLFCLLLCITLFAGAAFAMPPESPFGQGRQAELLAEGWQPVTDNVLQRSLGGNKTETFAYGPEGFAWMLQRLEDRLGFLADEYEKYPSENLRKVILDLQEEIGKMEKSLDTSQLALAEPIGGETLANCDISYGAHADAYPLYPGPGVGATADAYFHNNCFYWGKAEASVYVRATQGGITTSDSAGQTQEGENVQAAVTLTRNGVEDCYSSAWARASSDGLGIYYETFDANDVCPIPTLALTISGPLSVFVSGYTCRSVTWTASATGGVPGYTINWYRDGYYVGSGSSYTEFFCGNNWSWVEYVYLSAVVTDSLGATASDTHTTTIRYTSTGCLSKICPIEEELR